MRSQMIKPKVSQREVQLCSAISERINHLTIDQISKRYQYVSRNSNIGMESEPLGRLFNSRSGSGIKQKRNTKYQSVYRLKLRRQMKYRLNLTFPILWKVLKHAQSTDNPQDWKLSARISFTLKGQKKVSSQILHSSKTTLMVNKRKSLSKINRTTITLSPT